MGYSGGPKKMPRLRIRTESGNIVVRMLVCSIRNVDYIVCQDCENVCRWHSSEKYDCPGGTDSRVTYDEIIPEFVVRGG